MSEHQTPTLNDRLHALDAGEMTATALLDEALARATSAEGEFVHTELFEKEARAEAEAADTRRRSGIPRGPLEGLPITVKDLFDVTGKITTSGSKVLADQPPAKADAEAVRRLRRAGAVIVGHTNMVEFAYSGLGLNPHYGTPANPFDATRIPGGSSSGAGVAVVRGMAAAALGTDTGGSVRIPAAFSGLTGFKPTLSRVPCDGAFPLSTTLDSIGPIAPSVACCALLDAVLSDQKPAAPTPTPVAGLRLTVPSNLVLDGMDNTVSTAFDRTLQMLSTAGAQVREMPLDTLDHLPELGQGGGFTAAESYHIHREWLARRESGYDPRVSVRIKRGASMSAADYIGLHQRRAELMATIDRQMADWDALIMPTVPIVPPRFTELESDDEYARLNLLVLRNPTVANLLGLCAITLPCQLRGELPVGLMLVGRAMSDATLLRMAAGVENLLKNPD